MGSPILAHRHLVGAAGTLHADTWWVLRVPGLARGTLEGVWGGAKDTLRGPGYLVEGHVGGVQGVGPGVPCRLVVCVGGVQGWGPQGVSRVPCRQTSGWW